MTGKRIENDTLQEPLVDSGSLVDEFGSLYEEYLPKIYQYACYRITDRETAEDLTSDIFNKVLDAFKSYNSEKASFSTWLFAIARNTIIDYYRKRAKESKVQREVESVTSLQSVSPEEEVSKSEEINKLHECILKLNNNEQELISLKFSGGMTNREIARITNLSESNVGTILCRAIRKLRDEFSGWHYERE